MRPECLHPLLVAYGSYQFGLSRDFRRSCLARHSCCPSLFGIDAQTDRLRPAPGGAIQKEGKINTEGWSALLKDRILVYFLATAFLFHLANAAMLPELGEMLFERQSEGSGPIYVRPALS